MDNFDFNRNVIMLVKSFLSNRVDTMYNGSFLKNSPVLVGAPQGNKLGPILWLVYSNDFDIENFDKLQYAG